MIQEFYSQGVKPRVCSDIHSPGVKLPPGVTQRFAFTYVVCRSQISPVVKLLHPEGRYVCYPSCHSLTASSSRNSGARSPWQEQSHWATLCWRRTVSG